VTASFEASAPSRVDLAGAPLAVSVAIDRRAWCRVETGVAGIAFESKDTLQKVVVGRSEDLGARAGGPVALVREALRALGAEEGLRVVTQVKVPAASGLGGETALAVALVGALSRALGRELAAADLAHLAGETIASALGRPVVAADVAAALHGGCVAGGGAGKVERLDVDPAAVEECLRLVDVGAADGEPASAEELAGHGVRVRAALVERRLDDLAAALAEDWDARCRVRGWCNPERERIAAALRPAGAGLRACGGGLGSVVAIVAPPGSRGPGRREAVVAAAREASLRLFPARLDLLGLDVEKTA
jgi:galactokinase/mevalonate kinase-like predicted kinase